MCISKWHYSVMNQVPCWIIDCPRSIFLHFEAICGECIFLVNLLPAHSVHACIITVRVRHIYTCVLPCSTWNNVSGSSALYVSYSRGIFRFRASWYSYCIWLVYYPVFGELLILHCIPCNRNHINITFCVFIRRNDDSDSLNFIIVIWNLSVALIGEPCVVSLFWRWVHHAHM